MSGIIDSTGGAYGKFNVNATAVHVFGSFFTAPGRTFSAALTYWIIRLVASALVYYMLAAKNDSRSRRSMSSSRTT